MRISIILFLSCIFCLLFSSGSFAQDRPKPVTWKFEIPKTYSTGDEISVRLIGKLEKDWLLYSSENDSSEFINPAVIHFTPASGYELVNDIIELNTEEIHDEDLDEDLIVFKKEAQFIQRIRILKLPLLLKIKIDYTVSKREKDEAIVAVLDEQFSIQLTQK